MQFFTLLRVVCLLGLAVYWTSSATDPVWRALETLKFPRHEPYPTWDEVTARYASYSTFLLQQNPPRKREHRQVTAAYQYLDQNAFQNRRLMRFVARLQKEFERSA